MKRKATTKKTAKTARLDQCAVSPPPGPHYVSRPPKVVRFNGEACVAIDAESLASLTDWYKLNNLPPL